MRKIKKEREIKHLSVHQWLRSAIPDSQQPTSPISFLFLNLPPPPCAVLSSLIIYLINVQNVQIVDDLDQPHGISCGFTWDEEQNSRVFSP